MQEDLSKNMDVVCFAMKVELDRMILKTIYLKRKLNGREILKILNDLDELEKLRRLKKEIQGKVGDLQKELDALRKKSKELDDMKKKLGERSQQGS